jgi:L-threonylcarbamoyladenylate synthase
LPLRLDAASARPGEALLAFGPAAAPIGFAKTLWLSRSGDLAEAAANLFAMLRQLDRPAFTGIAVMPIPGHGLGRAINDRLHRAAAVRPRGAVG